jgi:hypothetical protein
MSWAKTTADRNTPSARPSLSLDGVVLSQGENAVDQRHTIVLSYAGVFMLLTLAI